MVVDAEVLNGARQGGAERVGLVAKGLHDLVALGRVRNTELDAPALDADAARHLDVVLAHQASGVVTQAVDLGAGDRGRIDFEQQMRAALEIEPEHDGLGRRRKDAVERRPEHRATAGSAAG